MPYPSDTTVITVNRALNEALRAYLDPGIEIRTDLPDPANPPPDPILSVFLYNIFEDLELRMGETRTNKAGQLQPVKVNECCTYMITYWDSQDAGTNAAPVGTPDNQALQVMNQVLIALINSRQLESIPGAYTRIIPPKDQGLNSLANFWQALGNKPRLLLNYVVTIVLTQTDKADVIPGVTVTDAVLEQMP
jgi:hypothetical protein